MYCALAEIDPALEVPGFVAAAAMKLWLKNKITIKTNIKTFFISYFILMQPNTEHQVRLYFTATAGAGFFFKIIKSQGANLFHLRGGMLRRTKEILEGLFEGVDTFLIVN